MILKDKFFTVVFLWVIIFLSSYSSVLAVDDGFIAARKISGQNLVIYLASGLDTLALLGQLNIGIADTFLAGSDAKPKVTYDEELARAVDALFVRVSDILDIRLYSYEGSVKICRDQEQLAGIYSNLFGRKLAGASSFYVHSLNSIYVTQESFKAGILGHEIAHAVISNYFVVLPSIRIQEILAGYVEFQLR